MSSKHKTIRRQTPLAPAPMQKAYGDGNYEDIDLKKLFRQNAYRTPRWSLAVPEFHVPISYMGSPQGRDNLKSFFVDPLALETNAYGSVRTISPWYG
jgi:hypothetical protein